MTTLAEGRQAIADAVSTVGDFNVGVRQPLHPKPLDGWVVTTEVRPSGFRRSMVTFQVVVFLSANEAQSDALFETYAVDVLNSVRSLPVSDVVVQNFVFELGQYGLTLTLSMEVQ